MNLNVDFHEVESAYRLMCDSESRTLFWDRLKYSTTLNKRYLLDLVDDALMYNKHYSNPSNIAFNSVLKSIFDNKKECDIIVWGASDKAMTIVELLYEFGFLEKNHCYYVDNDYSKCGKTFGWHNPHMYMPVYPPTEIQKRNKEAFVFLAVNTYSNDSKITGQLQTMGVDADHITHSLIGYEYFLGDMYLANGVMSPRVEDVFVDIGAFDMANTEAFIKWNPKFKHVYAFEADPVSYEKCVRKNLDSKVSIYNNAVWSSKLQLKFESGPNGELGGSRINDQGQAVVEAISLNEFFNSNEKIDIIKMDIEGAELEALKGASDVIRRNKPCLAISVYHKPEDIIRLPLYICELNSDYKFYIRHHTFGAFDTVMYAIDKNRDVNYGRLTNYR